MKILVAAVSAISAFGIANAGTAFQAPEMDAGAGIAAIALLGGIAALIRERTRRK